MKKAIIISAVVLVIGIAIWYYLKKKKEREAAAQVPVSTAPTDVKTAVIDKATTALGNLLK